MTLGLCLFDAGFWNWQVTLQLLAPSAMAMDRLRTKAAQLRLLLWKNFHLKKRRPVSPMSESLWALWKELRSKVDGVCVCSLTGSINWTDSFCPTDLSCSSVDEEHHHLVATFCSFYFFSWYLFFFFLSICPVILSTLETLDTLAWHSRYTLYRVHSVTRAQSLLLTSFAMLDTPPSTPLCLADLPLRLEPGRTLCGLFMAATRERPWNFQKQLARFWLVIFSNFQGRKNGPISVNSVMIKKKIDFKIFAKLSGGGGGGADPQAGEYVTTNGSASFVNFRVASLLPRLVKKKKRRVKIWLCSGMYGMYLGSTPDFCTVRFTQSLN